MGRILAAFVTLLIVVIVAAFAAPSFVDWNTYRGSIEATASGLVRWSVKANGTIDITLLPEPRIRLSQAFAKSPDGGATLSVDTVDIGLSLQALLGGRIEADKVTLIHPVLTVDLAQEHNGSGHRYAAAEALPLSAAIGDLRIVDGQAAISTPEYGPSKALSLETVNGVFSAQPKPGSFRFAGSAAYRGRQISAKFLAIPALPAKFKLTGNVQDTATKASVSADGMAVWGNTPGFDGSLSASAELAMSGTVAPAAIQVRSVAHVTVAGAVLDDLTLTLAPEDRPQTLTGAGALSFVTPGIKLSLAAPSFDISQIIGSDDSPRALLLSVLTAPPPLFQLYPDAEAGLSLAVDHTQIAGEGVDNLKLDAKRSKGRWVVEKLHAELPGDTSVNLAGAMAIAKGQYQTSGVISVDGRNLRRLTRWLFPQPANGIVSPASPFTMNASVTVSDDATVVDSASGVLDGAPYRGSVRYEKTPARKMSVKVAADALNLSDSGGLDLFSTHFIPELLTGQKPSFAGGITLLRGMMGGAEIVDLDAAFKSVRTASAEVHNFAARVALTPEALTISKLNVETADGLAIRGEGTVPSNGAPGRFEARLEARTADALLRAANAAGYGEDDLGGRSPADFAPATASVKYESVSAGGASAALTGNAGGTRFDAKAAWRADGMPGRLSSVEMQFNAAAVDGTRLLAQLYPQGVPSSSEGATLPASAQGPGTFTVRLAGPPDKLTASLALKTAAVQALFEGLASVETDGSSTASGKVILASVSPETVLPGSMLSFLGAQPRSPLRLEAQVASKGARVEATEIKAETAGNTTTGRVSFDKTGKSPRIDGELHFGKASLPSMLSVILVPAPASIPASSQDEVWPGRPFSLSTLQGMSSHLVLTAKTLKLGEALDITDAQGVASLDDGRLTLQKMRGKVVGADVAGTASFEAKDNAVTAAAQISLDDFDLARLSAAGKPPLAAGTADATLSVSGRALSPRGMIAVLKGRGTVGLSGGQISRISPATLQSLGEELTGQPSALNEDAINKRASDAVQAGDFKFTGLKTAFSVDNGAVEIIQGAFASREAGTVKLDATIDLATLRADSTWLVAGPLDRKQKFPPVKVSIAGSLASIESWPRSFSTEDFARSILVQKMDRDLTKLETLSKAPQPLPPWTTTQESGVKIPQRKGDGEALPMTSRQNRTFEDRIKGSLRPRDGTVPPDSDR